MRYVTIPRRRGASTRALGVFEGRGVEAAGNIGGALTRHFRAAGHEVAVANARGPESLAALAAETGSRRCGHHRRVVAPATRDARLHDGLDAPGVRRALAEANPERFEEWKATAKSPGTFEVPA